MSHIKTISASIAALVMAAGLIAMPAANAENNYAPGLPDPIAGEPNNPPRPAPVVPTVVLVQESVAAKAKQEAVPDPPAPKIGKAPFSPKVEAKSAIALTVPGLTPGTTYVVKIKKKGGKYGTLGSVVATSAGEGVLPVFRTTEEGTYILALVNQTNGVATYVKVKAS